MWFKCMGGATIMAPRLEQWMGDEVREQRRWIQDSQGLVTETYRVGVGVEGEVSSGIAAVVHDILNFTKRNRYFSVLTYDYRLEIIGTNISSQIGSVQKPKECFLN